jgi:hypothetical protein
MIATLQDGRTVRYGFKYGQLRGPTGKILRSTTCYLRAHDGAGDKEGKLLAETASYQSESDADNKSKARKIALARAIVKAFPDDATRRTVWKAYLGTVKDGRGITVKEKSPRA